MKRVWITTLVCLAALLLSLPPIYAGAECLVSSTFGKISNKIP
jgi:hypothetical protein